MSDQLSVEVDQTEGFRKVTVTFTPVEQIEVDVIQVDSHPRY